MFKSVDEVQRIGKTNLDLTAKSLAAVSKGLQTLATDAVDYTRTSFEASSATLEKLLGARSFDKAVEIHSEFARTAYERLVAQTTKVGDVITDMAKESSKPFEGILSKSSAK